MLRGMPIDQDMNMYAGFTDFVNLYSVIGGVAVTVLCLLHGLIFVTLRTEGDLRNRARKLGQRVLLIALPVLVVFVGVSILETDIYTVRPIITIPLTVLIVVCYVAALFFMRKERDGWTFYSQVQVLW